MPIRFRCPYCNRLLGIATRKAGTRTTCPHCGNSITVPIPAAEGEKTERINVEDVDELLGKSAGATVKEAPAPAAAAAAPSQPEVLEPEFEEPHAPASSPRPARQKVTKAAAAKPPPRAKSKPYDPDDPPLFEGDVDEILGASSAPDEEERDRPKPTGGLDAMSLAEPASRALTLTPQAATLLMVAVVVLMALSFAAGYLLAPRG